MSLFFNAKGLARFFVWSKTLTLMFPSTGTWVTFGGQISDEVSYVSNFIAAHEQMLAFIILDPANTTGEHLLQFTTPNLGAI